MKNKIVIVDYKMGNLHSVFKKLSHLGANPIISDQPSEITNCDKLILPGVGHFATAMNNIRTLGILDALNEAVLAKKKPILGICLGMQLMAIHGEEGNCEGLGWFDANVVRFKIKDSFNYKIPHTGWNQVKICKSSRLMQGLPENPEFYFVHSYHWITEDENSVLNRSVYEYEFISAVEKDNIFGVQYHPEKSHDNGNILMKNFIDI